MHADIAFEHVDFAYDGHPQMLKDVSFTVEKGTTLGILGGTGSGKTTLMMLLDKLYDLPDGCGKITVGGVDIRNIKTEYLRKNIGMVLQEPYLFSRTLGEELLRPTKIYVKPVHACGEYRHNPQRYFDGRDS